MVLITDPVGDTIIRIKNAYLVGKREVWIPHSKLAEAIVRVLQNYNFIEDFQIKKNGRDFLVVFLYEKSKKAFTDARQISKPGCRKYVRVKDIPYVRDGYGICILSTPQGIMSGREARQRNLGGELLLEVW